MDATEIMENWIGNFCSDDHNRHRFSQSKTPMCDLPRSCLSNMNYIVTKQYTFYKTCKSFSSKQNFKWESPLTRTLLREISIWFKIHERQTIYLNQISFISPWWHKNCIFTIYRTVHMLTYKTLSQYNSVFITTYS